MYKPLSELAVINPSCEIPRGFSVLTPVSFIPMSDVNESGHWFYHQIRSLGSVLNGFTSFVEGDVLVAKITPCMENGKGTLAKGLENGIGFGSTEFHVLRARSGTSSRFLFHISQSKKFRTIAETFMIGSAGQQRVQRQFFDAYLVPNLSFDEQEQIADILDTLDTTIRQTEAIIAKLQQVKQGLLHDLLTRGIDANGQLRPPVEQAPHLYKESPLGWIPREWRTTGLRNELTLQRGFDITVAEQRPGNIPVVSSSGITSFHNQAMVVGPGVVTGRKGKLGNTYYLDGPFWPHDTTLWVKDFHGNQPKFAAIFLHFLRLERFDAATSVPTLNRNFIHPMLVVFPAKQEQEKIVFQVETYENRIQAEHATLDKLRALKSALMDDLLTGRVRVTALLSGEIPASKELARKSA